MSVPQLIHRRMPLYELADNYADVLERLYEGASEEGVVDGDDKAALDAAEDVLADKAEACVKMLRDLTYHHETCKAEAAKLSAKAKAFEKKADWLKSYVLDALRSAHLDKLQAGAFRLSICKAGNVGVEVVDIDQVPSSYDKLQTGRELSLTAIKEDLKAGKVIPGVRLGTPTEFLKIT